MRSVEITSVIYDKLHLETPMLINQQNNKLSIHQCLSISQIIRSVKEVGFATLVKKDTETILETQRKCTNKYIGDFILLHKLN